jgi:hypothetical protein
MSGFDVLQLVMLGISAYQAYRACSVGERCGVAVAVFMLNVFAYVGSRVGVDRSVVALAVAFALLVLFAVVGL